MRGTKFEIITQENKGVGEAIRNGLKYCKGDFLTWPDPDDVLYKNNIERKVEFLINNPHIRIVRHDARKIEENTDKNLGCFSKDRSFPHSKNSFLDYIIEERVWFAPICFMIDFQFFKKCILTEVFPSKYGQNWQLLLPVLFNSECGFINEILADYYVREDSHSRSWKNVDKRKQKFSGHKRILLETVRNISNLNKQELIKIEELVNRKYEYIESNNYNYLSYDKRLELLRFYNKMYT